jgi:hypothetical protein
LRDLQGANSVLTTTPFGDEPFPKAEQRTPLPDSARRNEDALNPTDRGQAGQLEGVIVGCLPFDTFPLPGVRRPLRRAWTALPVASKRNP